LQKIQHWNEKGKAVFFNFYELEILETLAQDLKRNKGFPPLHDEFASFFTRNVYMRLRDRFNSPIQSVPGDTFELKERKSEDQNWTFFFTGKAKKVMNFGSYNYLGFAENTGKCAETAEKTTEEMSCTLSSPRFIHLFDRKYLLYKYRSELGTTQKHVELEAYWSAFLGVESTITFGMGFATNSMNIPGFAFFYNCFLYFSSYCWAWMLDII